MKFIDNAVKNYAALPPAEQAKIKAAWMGIGGIALYLLYEVFTKGWKHALGIFLAIAIFCTVAALAGFISMKLGKIFGEGLGTTIGAAIVLGFIGLVIFFIMANWGR